MYEVFKRVVNNEDLDEIVSDSLANLDEAAIAKKKQIADTKQSEFIQNYKTPSIRA